VVRCQAVRRMAASVTLLAAGLLVGCAGKAPTIEPQPGAVKGVLPAEADRRAELVRTDPVAYLRQVASNCRRLDQYTLEFTRFERRGLLQQMYGPEHAMCGFRREPFSVKMKWQDADLKYDESAYVAGQQENKVRFVTRRWIPPLAAPPAVNKVDLQTPVIWGESKRPMTDFGLERMMDRTLQSLQKAGANVVVSYRGLLELPDGGPTAHFIHLEFPASQYPVPIQELYIDVATDLPAGTILKYPSGKIDAAYYYYDVNTNVKLTDDDFLLDAEKGQSERSPKAEPSPTTRPSPKPDPSPPRNPSPKR
jgi:hypothetical protein